MERMKAKLQTRRSRAKKAALIVAPLAILAVIPLRARDRNQSAVPGQELAAERQASKKDEVIERSEPETQLLLRQTQQEADAKTRGCMSSGCHRPIDSKTMHSAENVRLG